MAYNSTLHYFVLLYLGQMYRLRKFACIMLKNVYVVEL